MTTSPRATAPLDAGVTGPPPARRRADLQRWAVPAGSVLVAVVAVLIWWLASLAYFVVPSPGDTLKALISSFGEDRKSVV